jgi:hypothetical protein
MVLLELELFDKSFAALDVVLSDPLVFLRRFSTQGTQKTPTGTTTGKSSPKNAVQPQGDQGQTVRGNTQFTTWQDGRKSLFLLYSMGLIFNWRVGWLGYMGEGSSVPIIFLLTFVEYEIH